MCESCNVLNIQGVNCHETGCPDAWIGHLRECKNCDNRFIPEERDEIYCCIECCREYHGFSNETDDNEIVTDNTDFSYTAFDDIEIDCEYVPPMYELIRE